MTLQQIEYVLAIADTGSMNQAAKKLYISQPTLTSSVKELENETGISIFYRTSKGVVPTNDGIEFLNYARQLYQHYKLISEKYSKNRNIKQKFGVSSQHYSFAVKAFAETAKKYNMLEFEFAMRETKTQNVIDDVGSLKSEIGILYTSDFNKKIILKLLHEQELEFHNLIQCRAYVYLWKKHPLAAEKSISFRQLEPYPCLSFEQGEHSSFYFAEEILSENEYPRMIKTCDRATMLNLMIGLNGYTLCSGIISEDLNGNDYIAVPFREDNINTNSIMQIGYITKKRSILSPIGKDYISEVEKYLAKIQKNML